MKQWLIDWEDEHRDDPEFMDDEEFYQAAEDAYTDYFSSRIDAAMDK